MTGEPQNAKLEMGFNRPVRSMVFTTPITIGKLVLRDVIVRTTDTGSTVGIPDEEQDPNEILVAAKSKQKAVHGMFVGTASFENCSSLIFDKIRGEIRFSCN